MHGYLHRELYSRIRKKLNSSPVVAILGPRQCGKTTLVRHLATQESELQSNTVFLDLESPRDAAKLQHDAETFFYSHHQELICLDEIQRSPELFAIMRSVIDQNNRNAQFIVLGSASPELIRQSSESLAGRISYLELTPFLWQELSEERSCDFQKFWLQGGFPGSVLQTDEEESLDWRLNYIQTYLERDLPVLGINLATPAMRRLWQMCAHLQGQTLNMSQLANSLGISQHKVRGYLDVLQQTYLIRQLQPYESNVKKRLVKSPKLYIRDTGLLHALLDVQSFDDLLGHPVFGASWEGLVIENIVSSLPRWQAFFYRTSHGAEMDLILKKGTRLIAIECKASSAPKVSRGFWSAKEDLNPEFSFVVAPVEEAYSIAVDVLVCNLSEVLKRLQV